MRSTILSALSVAALCFSAGCAPVEGDDSTSSPAAIVASTCPEVVTLDWRREPRNAAGQVRYCWPGMANCYCDSDNDCYATDGYVACTPRTTTTTTTTTQDSGVRDTGVRDSGTDTGPRDTGTTVTDTGPRDTGTTVTDTGASTAGAPTIGGCAIFPANNPWNQDVSALAVHPSSAAIIANIQAHGQANLQADFGSNLAYGIPYTVVPATQTFVPINFTEYGDESDPGPYPVPMNARIEGGNDDHVLVLQQGSCMLFEMYHASPSGTRWNAGSGATFDLRSNALRPRGWTSCDQAGLPILPGLARYDEATAGEIRHALRVTFAHTRNAFIPPATHPGGNSDVNAPPMGMRLRLKASYDISRFTGHSRVILNALRRYGMFVADTGANWYVSGATDSRWNDNDLGQLRSVPGTAFEVVNTGAALQ